MGKKTFLKNFIHPSQSQLDNNNNDIVIDLKDSNTIIKIISSNDLPQKDALLLNIAQNTFDPSDDTQRNVLLNIPFLQLLSNEVLSTSFQSKDNAFSALTNILTTYDDYEADSILLFNTSLMTNINLLLKDLLNIPYNQPIDSAKKTYLLLYDLLALIIDLLQNKEQSHVNKIDLESIAYNVMMFIMQKKGKDVERDEDLLKQSLIVLYQIVSFIPISNDNSMIVKNFMCYLIEINNEIIEGSDSLIKALFSCLLFYLLCANSNSNSNQEVVIEEDTLSVIFPQLIEKIYKGINYDLRSQMEAFNNEVVNYTKSDFQSNYKENNINEEEIIIDDKMLILKDMINQLDMITHTIYCYIKTFNDIIENTEISSVVQSNIINNIEDYDDEDIEMQEEDKENNNIIISQDNHYDNIISSSITKYLLNNKSSTSLITFMLSNNFISNLYKLQCNYTIEVFYLHDFSKMLHIKSYLNEIEYLSFTLINNILIQFPSILSFSLQNQTSLLTIISKRLLIDEVTSDTDNTSIIILCLRSLLFSSPSLSFNNSPFDLYSIDYRLLFRLMNKHINSVFIKCNIVDIIAYIFSNESMSLLHLDANLEICQLLNSLFYNEGNIEVLSHVINALMDIYQGDNAKVNKNLKRVGCVQLMKNGSSEFMIRMKTGYKSGDITPDVYEYVKETYKNMKRFIKYKENSFLLLKI